MNQYHLRAKDTSVMPVAAVPAPTPEPQNPLPELLPASIGGGVNKVTDTAGPLVNEPTSNG